MNLSGRISAFAQAIGADIKELFARVEAAEGSTEVFIGSPATLPDYAALVFEEAVIEGQTVYVIKVNVP
jgi:hypothetical protein